MSAHKPNCIALIPARSGSKRVADKNVRPLAGHPLMAYTIAAALESRVFDAVVVSTDSQRYADIAKYYGAEAPFLRSETYAGDRSPDIEWVKEALERLAESGRRFDCFSILRPTSPFRRPETIQRAWRQFISDPDVDSLRAVELCEQHPAKMWTLEHNRMKPVLEGRIEGQPMHSCQYAALPPVYAQNASLEIAWVRVALEENTISGKKIAPFLTQNFEGFDVNRPFDWSYAEELLRSGQVSLPRIKEKALVS